MTPKPVDVSDTAAMAVLLVTQFTVSNGGEERNALMRQEFRKRFGKRLARALSTTSARPRTPRPTWSPSAPSAPTGPGR